MAIENRAQAPPIQAPGRGAVNIVYLTKSERNLLPSIPAAANTSTFDYLSAFRPFLNNDQEIPVSKEVKMSDPTREEMKAEIAASKARGDTKIARIEGKLDLVLQAVQSSRDEAKDNRRAIIANNWVIFGAIIAVVGIILTVAPVIFDMGFKWRETITKEVQDRIPAVPAPKNLK